MSLRAVLRLFVSLNVLRNQRGPGHKRICTHYTPSLSLSLSLSLSSYARQYRSDIRETKRDDGARRTFAGEERHQAVPKSWAAVVGLMVHVLFFSRASSTECHRAALRITRTSILSSCSDASQGRTGNNEVSVDAQNRGGLFPLLRHGTFRDSRHVAS